MSIDAKKLRPSELCRLLNSTPLGEVLNASRLRRHRERAGWRFSDDKHIDLLRFIAYLFQVRHFPKQPEPRAGSAPANDDQFASALTVAAFACRKGPRGHGQKFTRKQEAAIAALLTEPNYAKAAAKAGIGKATLCRWLKLSEFQDALRQARRKTLDESTARIQSASGLLVDSVMQVALHGRRESDKTRAALALLDRAHGGPTSIDALDMGERSSAESPSSVQRLECALRQVEQSDLPVDEKVRLTATLIDAQLRARKVESLTERLETVEAALRRNDAA